MLLSFNENSVNSPSVFLKIALVGFLLLIPIFSFAAEEDTEAPYLSVDTLGCGRYYGNLIDMPNDSKIRSNLATIQQSGNANGNYKFSHDPFEEGETYFINWNIVPIDSSKDAEITITFIDNAGNQVSYEAEYHAPYLFIEPELLQLNTINVGESSFRDFLLINKSTHPIIVDQMTLKKTSASEFEIEYYTDSLPFPMNPGDSIRCRISTYGKTAGYYTDSIGVGNSCSVSNIAKVEVSVIAPIIEVDDIDFSKVPMNQDYSKTAKIYNRGAADLKIYSVDFPTESVFEVSGLDNISEAAPLILRKGESFQFGVTFKSENNASYNSRVIFFSNALATDSICYINAESSSAKFSNSLEFFWDRLRIDLPDHPIAPYPASSQLVFRNFATNEQYRILSPEFDNDAGSFLFDGKPFDEDLLNAKLLDAGDSLVFDVSFKPTRPGIHSAILSFRIAGPSATRYKVLFSGTGIVPRVRTGDYDFGTTIVQFSKNPPPRFITITNEHWEFADSMMISDLTISPDPGVVSKVLTEYGTEGFKYDSSAINLPKVLQAGESLEFQVFFLAQKEGPGLAELIPVCDSENKDTVHLKGYGILKGIRVTDARSDTICYGELDTLVCILENYGSGNINVDSIRFAPSDVGFSLLNETSDGSFTVLEDSQREVKILYDPPIPGKAEADIIIYNSAENNRIVYGKVEGESFYYKADTYLSIPDAMLNSKIGDIISASVMLRDGPDLAKAKVNDFTVEIRYPKRTFKVIPDSIRIGELIAGRFLINNIQYVLDQGKVYISLSSEIEDDYLIGKGELLQLDFNTYLPLADDDDEYRNVELEIFTNDNKCVDFRETDSPSITFKDYCRSKHKIEFKEYANETPIINPNPASSVINIKFSIADHAFTKLEIYNSVGKLIKIPLSRILEAGKYETTFDTDDLSSGLYWCVLISGNISISTKFIVVE